MHDTLRSLLSHLIDYAGLFPPAKLDMPPMVENYARYLDSDDSWMLSRVIVPVARLTEFEKAAAELLPHEADADPWLISALTRPAGDDGLQPDIDAIQAFNEQHADPGAGLARVDVIECRAADHDSIEAALDVLPDDLFPFFEISPQNDPRGTLAALVGSDAGAKIRTGGVTADLYPGIDQVARFIVACTGAGVPFKGTAGMHHPLRHYSDKVQTDEHGFLNVFLAACFADAGADETAVATILGIESSERFKFSDLVVTVDGHALDLAQIEHTRARRAISFGSCSFDEPREDLVSLGLLRCVAS